MKLSLIIFNLGCAIFLSRGVMAQHMDDLLSQEWVTIQDKRDGVEAQFPHHPLEMAFDLPFQNTPPSGQVHFYSVPSPKGLLVLSTYHSSSLSDQEQLKKEDLYQFFEKVLVPHFFFNPSVFEDHQVFKFKPIHPDDQRGASFQFSFRDHAVEKRLEGMAFLKDQTLYIPFYLASESDFDQKILHRFLESIHFTSKR